MSSDHPPSTDVLQKGFLLLAVGAVSGIFLWMVSGFLMALLLGAITAGLTHPIHHRLAPLLGGRRVIASGLIVVALILLVIGPLTGFIGLVVSQAVEITQEVGPWVESEIADPEVFSALFERLPFAERIPKSILPEREKIIEVAGNAIRAAGSTLIENLAAAGRGTASFLLQLFIYLYTVFFLLLSGRDTLERVLYLSPLEPEDEARIIERFLSVTRATLRGSLSIGALQGFLAGVGFAVAGVPGAAFWGTIIVVLSVIPGIGGPIVWIPAVIWLLATGAVWEALLLALWCALLVSSIDNVLRPRWVGSDAKMSDLMILISTLGGLSLFGPAGFIVGPIVAALFVTLWDMYGRVFAESLPAVVGFQSPADALKILDGRESTRDGDEADD